MADIIQSKDLDKNKRVGTGFTGVQQLMQANQGNRLGSTVGQGIQNTANQAKQNINQASNQFQQQAQSNRIQLDDTNQQKVNSLLNDPTKANEQDTQQFQKLASGQYQGPTQIENSAALAGKAQEATRLGQLAGSQEGKQALLQRFVAAPKYTAGQQRLDTLLLGQQGNQQLAQAKRDAMGVDKQALQSINAAQQAGQAYQNEAQNVGQNVTNQFVNKVKGIDTDLTNRANQVNDQNLSNYNNTLDKINKGQISAEDAQRLGLGNGTNIYDVDLSKYLSKNNIDATKQNIADPDTLNRINALKALGGNSALTSEAGGIFDAYNGAKGGYNEQAYNIDKDALTNAIQERGNQYNQAITAPQSSVNEASGALNGDMYFNGGMQNAANTFDSLLRSFNADKSSRTTQNFQKIADILNSDKTHPYARDGYFDAKKVQDAYFNNQLGGYNNDLYNRVQSEQQKQSAAQQALQQLINQYGGNRTLSVGSG